MNDKTPNLDLEFEEVTQPEASTETPETPEGQEIPEKYQGKSVFDIIEMHRQAEKKISQQGQDLGEQRRLSDAILGLRKENVEAPKEPPQPITADEVFTDPNQAIDKVLRNSDVARKQQALDSRLDSLERSIGQKEFEERHPTFIRDAETPEFLDWVKANKARTSLLAKLHYDYDFSAGNDLWDMWDEVRPATDNGDKKKDVLRAAKTVKSGPSDTSRKTVYSRAKLLSLQERAMRGDNDAKIKWNDPDFQKEYLAAYAEGRIR
jgi:hypothetical protein